MRRFLPTLSVFTVLLASTFVHGHEDRFGAIVSFEKEYDAQKPVGRMRLAFTAGDGKEAKPSLALSCDLFRASIPTEGLIDLPRPDWESAKPAYSLTSYDKATKGLVERPYLYVMIGLHGPIGQSWSSTWVTYHFDDKGQLERKLKRFVDLPGQNATRVLWVAWPIGDTRDAAAVLEAAAAKE